MNINKVFLGGTWNKSNWRESLIKDLKISYYNPIVEDWTEDCIKEELKQREECEYCLYVITPFMKGVYSIAEVVDDSNKRPEKTIFCVLEREKDKHFDKDQMKSLNQVGKMVKKNGGNYFSTLKEVTEFLNK